MIFCVRCGVLTYAKSGFCRPCEPVIEPPAPTFIIEGYRMQTATQPPKGLYE